MKNDLTKVAPFVINKMKTKWKTYLNESDFIFVMFMWHLQIVWLLNPRNTVDLKLMKGKSGVRNMALFLREQLECTYLKDAAPKWLEIGWCP